MERKGWISNYFNESTGGAMPRWYTPTMHVRQIGRGSLVINRCGYASLSTSYSSASTTVRPENITIVRRPIFSRFSIGGVIGAPNGLEVHKFCLNSRTKHYFTKLPNFKSIKHGFIAV